MNDFKGLHVMKEGRNGWKGTLIFDSGTKTLNSSSFLGLMIAIQSYFLTFKEKSNEQQGPG